MHQGPPSVSQCIVFRVHPFAFMPWYSATTRRGQAR